VRRRGFFARLRAAFAFRRRHVAARRPRSVWTDDTSTRFTNAGDVGRRQPSWLEDATGSRRGYYIDRNVRW
jgi:hypothetical protein